MTASGVRMGDAIETAGDEKRGDVWKKSVPKKPGFCCRTMLQPRWIR
jgi:hypothetical protein